MVMAIYRKKLLRYICNSYSVSWFCILCVTLQSKYTFCFVIPGLLKSTRHFIYPVIHSKNKESHVKYWQYLWWCFVCWRRVLLTRKPDLILWYRNTVWLLPVFCLTLRYSLVHSGYEMSCQALWCRQFPYLVAETWQLDFLRLKKLLA